MNRRFARIALVAVLATIFLTSRADAAGNFRLINETPNVIHPWFKSSCLTFGSTTGWNFFGGIAPNGGQFEWPFASFLQPGCTEVFFTYTLTTAAPADPVPDERLVRFKIDSERNVIVQVGKKLNAHGLGALQENDNDDGQK